MQIKWYIVLPITVPMGVHQESLHLLSHQTPLKRALRKRWITARNRKKKDIENAKNPCLCEDHFDPESFQKIPQLAREIGCRLILKPDALPDPKLFTRVAVNLSSNPSTSEISTACGRKRKNLAFGKQQNLSVSIFD